MAPPKEQKNTSAQGKQKRPRPRRPNSVHVNLSAILCVDHACNGCSTPGQCCCASYEVCADSKELKRIVNLLPEAARFCPRLKTKSGYDIIFDEIEPGLFALDTDEKGLCLLAYKSGGKIRCSLHSAALKLGLSLDGRIADSAHSSRWITGPEAREMVQAMRQASDAVMVGAGTVRHDNPSLWPRPDGKRNPWRIIVVRQGPLPLSAQVFTDEHVARTIVAAPRGWQPALARKIRQTGATVLELPSRRFLPALAKELGKLGILRVLCEGGGILAGKLIQAGLVDELCVFLAPMLIGGPVGAMGTTEWRLVHAPRFRLREFRSIGNDLLVRFDPMEPPGSAGTPRPPVVRPDASRGGRTLRMNRKTNKSNNRKKS